MASKINIQEKIVEITDVSTLEKMCEVSQTKCVVIDVHQAWCGPCTAIHPFYSALWLDLDDAENQFVPCTLDMDNVEGVNVKLTPWCKANGITLADQGCKPIFLVLRHGSCVGAVDGVNTSALQMLIDLNVPKSKKKEK